MQRAIGVVAPGRRHAVRVARARRLVVGIDHIVVSVGAGQTVVVNVVNGAVGVPGLGLNDRAAIGPDRVDRLAVGIKRVARRVTRPGNAGDDEFMQRAVGIVAPALGHAVRIGRAHRLVVGIDHIVIGVGAGQTVVVDVVNGAVWRSRSRSE